MKTREELEQEIWHTKHKMKSCLYREEQEAADIYRARLIELEKELKELEDESK